MDLKEIYALVDYLVEEKLSQVNLPSGLKGSRGPRGFDGKDFSWDENQSEILKHIRNNSITFEKLTPEQVESIRGKDGEPGLRGLKGRDGKDFNWDEHKKEILTRVDSTKLKFSDLSTEEKESLKGSRGFRGQKGAPGKRGIDGKDGLDGSSFNWDDHVDEVSKIIKSNKLKLSKEEIESLRGEQGIKGPKGVAGKDGIDGQNFVWNDHKEKIFNKIESHKLKFSDLSEKEVESLKGARGYRGQKGARGSDGQKGIDGKDGAVGKSGVPGIQGLQGFAGRDGRSGLDGLDGEDAPTIIDIQLREDRGTFYFVFYFSNGSIVETKSIDKPVVESIIQNTVMYAGGGSSTGGGASVLEVYKDSILAGLSESLNFTGDNIVVSYDSNTSQSTISVTEKCIPVLDEGTQVASCLNSIDFVGAGVTVVNTTVMADWTSLSIVTSMANYQAFDTGNVVVNIPQNEISAKLGVTRIASEDIAQFSLVRLVSSTHVANGSSDTELESKISGIALNAALTGENVDFVMFGIIEDASFVFPLLAKLFLQSNGTLGLVPPSAVGQFIVVTGESLGTGAVFVNIQEPEEII